MHINWATENPDDWSDGSRRDEIDPEPIVKEKHQEKKSHACDYSGDNKDGPCNICGQYPPVK